MPLPLAHSAVGLAAYLAFRKNILTHVSRKRRWALAALVVVAANLPDLDFLPGLLVGQPNRFHHGPSHSLAAAAIAAGLLYALSMRFFGAVPRVRLFTVLLVASLSHSLLDYCSADTSQPYGVPLFWPISSEYHIS